MKKKLAYITVPLAAGLAVIAWVFLLDRAAPSPDAGALAPARQSEAAPAVRAAPAAPDGGPAASVAEAQLLVRSTETTGDLTRSRLRGGDLGYVDAGSIINGNDPYSIAAFLQAHSELTGADESLEIEIRNISEYPASIRARFNQIIDGKRSPQGKGSVSFDPATGAVISAMSSLVAPDPALAGNVAILQEEAVAIAREAAARAVLQGEPVTIVSNGETVRVQPRLRPGTRLEIFEATPKELRYALDPETRETRAEWPVWVGAAGTVGGGFSWEVLVDASTGEIVGINDQVREASAGCSDLTFSVCDGSLMSDSRDECGEAIFHVVEPLPDSHPDAARAIGWAKGMTADIKNANPDYIGQARGNDCEVEIVVNVPKAVMGEAPGQYIDGHGPNQGVGRDRILLASGAGRSTAAHEVMHALTKTTSDGVEHGLVDSAEALHMGGGWGYGNKDFTIKPESMTADMHAGVAHAIYSIYQELDEDKNTAFKIVLGTDLEEPNSGSAYEVISEVAHDLGVGATVDNVLYDLGVAPTEKLRQVGIEALESMIETSSDSAIRAIANGLLLDIKSATTRQEITDILTKIYLPTTWQTGFPVAPPNPTLPDPTIPTDDDDD